MNGRKAREIREVAWELTKAEGLRGNRVSPARLKSWARRLRRYYTRHHTLPRQFGIGRYSR